MTSSFTTNLLFTKVFNDLNLNISHSNHGIIHQFKGRNTLPVNRIYVSLGECGFIEWNGKKLMLKKNTITFMPYNIPLSYSFHQGLFVSFHFNIEFFPNIDLFSNHDECHQIIDRKLCLSILKSTKQSNSFKSILTLYNDLIHTCIKFLNPDLSTFSKKATLRNKHKKWLDYIHNNLDAQLTIEKVANECGLTRNQLSKSFNRDFGISLKKYMTQQLIRKASSQLFNYDSIKEVANSLNFSDEFYFSRFFKKHTHMSPSSFKDLPEFDRKSTEAI